MTSMAERSNLHLVTVHDGSRWLGDSLVEGDYHQKLTEVLEGEPTRKRVLIEGVSQAFYRGARSALVMTFRPELERSQVERMMGDIREGRDDTN